MLHVVLADDLFKIHCMISEQELLGEGIRVYVIEESYSLFADIAGVSVDVECAVVCRKVQPLHVNGFFIVFHALDGYSVLSGPEQGIEPVGIQTIQYQLVTLMTCNGQTPFVTMFMYFDEAPEGQTREDLAMLIKEVLTQRIQGIKNEKGVYVTPAFPKVIYVLDEDNIEPGTKYYYLTKLAAECTAKRMVPDYISAKVMREVKGDVYTCMGCRSFLIVEDSVRNPDGSHKFYGRFNQGVCSVNLVDVACLAVKASEENGTDRYDEFWKIFDERLEMCHRALQIRHKRLLGTKSDVAPILWQHGSLARLKKVK